MSHKTNMVAEFAPKGAEVLQAEITADLGVDYEGNEEMVDKMVARELKSEEFKASLHKDKMSNREKLKETRKLAGLDPETGEKLQTNVVVEPKSEVKSKFSLSDLEEAAELLEIPKGARQEVADYAERKGITISEAKSNTFIKSYLQNHAEELKTAQATQVKTSGRSSSKSNDEKILEDFENGIATEDPEALARARYNAILKKRKN